MPRAAHFDVALPATAKDHEFIATNACRNACLGRQRLEPRSDLAQNGISRRMTMGIVDRLEAIEINYGKPARCRIRHFPKKRLDRRPCIGPIWQHRQEIVIRPKSPLRGISLDGACKFSCRDRAENGLQQPICGGIAFVQAIVHAGLHGILRHRHTAKAGEHHDRDVVCLKLWVCNNLKAVTIRQAVVEKHAINTRLFEYCAYIIVRLCLKENKLVRIRALEEALVEHAVGFVVINDEHPQKSLAGARHAALTPGASLGSRTVSNQ